MSSEDANSGFFLFGAGPLLGAALNADALASAKTNSTASAIRMTFPRRPLPPGGGEEPRVAILWRLRRQSAVGTFRASPVYGRTAGWDRDPSSRGVLCAEPS